MPIEKRAALDQRLSALAARFRLQARSSNVCAAEHAEFLRDHAASLDEFATQVQEEYVRLIAEDIPTPAQGDALARFLRPAFRDRRIGAHVCRGGQGLPEDYLHVRLSDGYEAGIAPDGRTST